MDGGGDLGQVVFLQLQGRGGQPAANLLRCPAADDGAGDGGEGQGPGDRDGGGGDAVPFGYRVQRLGQGQVGGQGGLGEVGVAAAPVAGVQGGGSGGGEGASEQAGGHRAVDDDAGVVLVSPPQHVVGGVAVDQAELGLDGVHRSEEQHV